MHKSDFIVALDMTSQTETFNNFWKLLDINHILIANKLVGNQQSSKMLLAESTQQTSCGVQ